jgi:hypothetical protein
MGLLILDVAEELRAARIREREAAYRITEVVEPVVEPVVVEAPRRIDLGRLMAAVRSRRRARDIAALQETQR